MGGTNDRRGFLKTAAGAGRRWAWPILAFSRSFRRSRPTRRRSIPKMVRSSARSSRWSACWRTPRATGCWKRWRRGCRRDWLSRSARRALAGRRAQHSAAARSASSSTRCWWSTRPTWPASPRPTTTAGCRSSGRSTTSRASQAQNVTRGQLDDGAGRRVGRARARTRPRGLHRGDGQLGRSGGRRRRRRAGPLGRPQEIYELFFRYGCATSATSATRRSTSPTAGGRSSASAGSTPSRCCARWPMPS